MERVKYSIEFENIRKAPILEWFDRNCNPKNKIIVNMDSVKFVLTNATKKG